MVHMVQQEPSLSPAEKTFFRLTCAGEGRVSSYWWHQGDAYLSSYEKNWVTVFAHSQDSKGKTKVFHEIAPGNFVNRDTRQLLLRIVPAGVPLATGKKQEADYLRLEVRSK